MLNRIRRATLLLTVVVAVLAVVRAATHKYQDQERAIREACQADLQKQGLTPAAAKAKYPTPVVSMVSSGCLVPGGTGEIAVKGTFSPGTKFVVENDNLEVVKDSLVGGEYHATLKVAPGIGPQTAEVTAINPRCMYARGANHIQIGGQFEWSLDTGAKGWTVAAHPLERKACVEGTGDRPYELQFFRKGEPAPFEKRRATLSFEAYNATYRFSISEGDSGMEAFQQLMQTKMQELANPKTTPAQRELMMKQLERAQGQMQDVMKRMTDPNYIKQQEEKRKQFGCRSLELQGQAAALTGTLYCAEAAGNRIPVTGSLKYLGQ
jgi:hypothetical protein